MISRASFHCRRSLAGRGIASRFSTQTSSATAGAAPQKEKDEIPSSPIAPLANASRKLFGGAKDRFEHMAAGAGDALGSRDSSPGASSKATPVDENGYKILYRGQQELVVRMLFGASSFNFVYWTYYTTSAWYYEGVTAHGLALAGDMRWGALGAFATGLMFYATKTFKDNAAMTAYLVEGTQGQSDRLGFQMHNFFGGPGRRVEANVANVRVLKDGDGKNGGGRFGSSFIPLRVKGMGKNVLIDDKGEYYYDNLLKEILQRQLALSPQVVASAKEDDEYFAGEVDSKERRILHSAGRLRKLKNR